MAQAAPSDGPDDHDQASPRASFFDTDIIPGNEEQDQLQDLLHAVFTKKSLGPADYIEGFRATIPVYLLICKEVQVDNALYSDIRRATVAAGITFPAVAENSNGNKIACRVLKCFFDGPNLASHLQQHDLIYRRLLRERRALRKEKRAGGSKGQNTNQTEAGNEPSENGSEVDNENGVTAAEGGSSINEDMSAKEANTIEALDEFFRALATRIQDNSESNQSINNHNHTGRNNVVQYPSPTEVKENKRKAVKAFQDAFRNVQFRGHFDESIVRHLKDFEDLAETWEVPFADRVSLFRHSIIGNARSFWEEHNTLPWHRMMDVFKERYASDDKQAEVSSRMAHLRLSEFRGEGGDDLSALDKLITVIDKLAPLAEPEDLSERAKAKFLKAATAEANWSIIAISRAPIRPTYSQLISAYKSTLVDMTGGGAKAAMDVGSGAGSPREDLWGLHKRGEVQKGHTEHPTLFANHGKFARDPRNFVRNKLANLRSATPSSHAVIGCFNCGRQDCSVSSCPQPRDTKRIAENLSKWRLSRRVPRTQRVNITTLAEFADGNQEAGEVLFASSILETGETTDEDGGTRPDELMTGGTNEGTNDLQKGSGLDGDGTFKSTTDPLMLFSGHNPRVLTTMTAAPSGDYSQHYFHGLCIDTGATRSVCGIGQAKAYFNLTNSPFKLHPTLSAFRFGDAQPKNALGTLPVRVPLGTPTDQLFVSFNIDVVDADIPMIIGLDLLRENRLRVDNLELKLQLPEVGIEVPVVVHNGHLFYRWGADGVLYTTAELQRLHLHFAHPSAGKLYQLIKRADPTKATPEVRRVIESIAAACESCRSFHPPPFRFRASLPPNKLVFNKEVAMDLMFIEGVPILHIVDTHTNFQNATVLRSKRAEDIWNAFVECWASTYVGYPSTVRFDQEAAATANVFRDAATAHGIELQFSGVASHNSIGVGERYHQPLRRVFRLLQMRYPTIHPEVILRYSVKALNDTVGPNGLVPTLLVFGTLPSFPLLSSNQPEQKERMKIMRDARTEAANITAEHRLKLALNSNTPPSESINLRKGDKVRVFDEKGNWWAPGYRVVNVDKKQVWVTDGVRVSQLHRAHVLPDPADTDERDFAVLLRRLKPFSQPIPTIYITDVIKHSDPEVQSVRFDEAKAREIVGLLDRGCFSVAIREELPEGANVMGGRFVLAVKNRGTKEEVYKARFVVQGHTDAEKDLLVHTSATTKHHSIKLLIALAATFNFRLWSQDVAQAYIQAADKIMREVYVRGAPEFQLNSGQLFKILRPLYGLSDSGDYWYERFHQHLTTDLRMMSSASDPCLFYKSVSNKLCGLIASHVDDTLGAGSPEFIKECATTESTFYTKGKEYDNTRFAGVTISKRDYGFFMHQEEYCNRLEKLDEDCDFESFRSRRHELAWLTHTRPDLLASVAILSQVTRESFCGKHTKELNKVIKRAKSNAQRGVRQHELDRDNLRMVAYSDASFANLSDNGTQLGYVIFLTDNSNRVNLLHAASFKCKRVVRSVLGGETYAFADVFEIAFTMRHDIKASTGLHLPLALITDSQSLFKVIIKSSVTTERRLMIDIAAVKEAYRSRDITDVGWVRSEANPADGFTKLGACPLLEDILDTGRLDVKIDQWVLRSESHPSRSPTGDAPVPSTEDGDPPMRV